MQNELYHYGIPRKSGRYPWGSGDRPYQGDGGPFERLKNKLKNNKTDNKGTVKKKKAAAPSSKKAGKEKPKAAKTEPKKTPEDNKAEALKSKSATKIYKVKDQLSDQELRETLNRLNMEKQLRSLSNEEIEAGRTFIKRLDAIQSTANKIIGYANTARNLAKLFEGKDDKSQNNDKKEEKKKSEKKAIEKKSDKTETPKAETKSTGLFDKVSKLNERAKTAKSPERSKSETKTEEPKREESKKEPDFEWVSGSVEGEGRSRRTERDNTYFDMDAEWREYKPSSPTLSLVNDIIDAVSDKPLISLPDSSKQLPALLGLPDKRRH